MKKKIPIIYVNDNFGNWRANWELIYSKCASSESTGRRLAELLKPTKSDLFVLKPRHSGFYSTNLEPLLQELKIRRLILTGIAGNICVLFTAHDAHMRNYEVVVPRDCVASNTATGDRFLIYQLCETLKLSAPLSKSIR